MANLSFVFEEIKDEGSEIKIDDTLTKPGQAADADAVRKAIVEAVKNAATRAELADYAKKAELVGLATEGYVDGEISDALSQFDIAIKEYIQNTFLNGAW